MTASEFVDGSLFERPSPRPRERKPEDLAVNAERESFTRNILCEWWLDAAGEHWKFSFSLAGPDIKEEIAKKYAVEKSSDDGKGGAR